MVNNKLNVLCLSFWTPPNVRPQAILIGKMIPEWIKQGINPVIITYDTGSDWQIDAPIYKIPQYRANKILNRIYPLRKLLWYLYYRKIFNIAKEAIKKHGCEIVFSFSNPQDSNIIGAMLKEKTGIKFVSHFSDPWYDSIYKSFSNFAAKKVLRKEEYIINNSDNIIFITEETKRLVMKKFDEKQFAKARVIPHCYDLKDYPEIQKNTGGKFVISYIGAFYKQRNPEVLFRALQIVKDKGINNFIIQLVGSANPYAGYSEEKINGLTEKYDLKEYIEIVPVVPYKESLKLMKEADCLVVIDADVADSPFLTSKVVDYAGSGSAIVGITPDNSPTEQFLTSLGFKAFNYKEEKELAEYLSGLINKEAIIQINQEYLNQFDVSRTTAKLLKLFERALYKKNQP